MAAISVRELTEQLNDFMKTIPTSINKDAMILQARVCSITDREYPEGTIILTCMNENTNEKTFNEQIKSLVIYPGEISQLN